VADRGASDGSLPVIVVATLMRPLGGTGVQTHFNGFLRFLEQRGVRATCVTPFSAPRAVVDPVLAMRRVVDRLSKPAGVWWYRRWHETLLKHVLARELRGEQGRVVVYAQCPVSAAAALRARGNKEQLVVMAVHFNISQADEWVEKERLSSDGRLYRSIQAFEEVVLPQLDGLVYVSEFMRKELEARIPSLQSSRSSVIPNFLELPPPRDPTRTTADIVNVGTLEPRKNQGYLLKILRAAKDMGWRYTLTLIGDGPDRAALERLASREGISDQVRFLGHRPDASRLVGEHRLYCHVARMENFGLAILEAMARGVPVIATPVGGTPEVFRASVEGLFWPLDKPEEAARELIALLEDESLLTAMGLAGRRRVENHFTTEAVGERLLEFLSA
jgi:glycosyltransferase involved in cell wall biosynthesis